MASGKRRENESYKDYKLRLWCEEKAYRLYRSRRMPDLSFDGCVKKIKDIMGTASNIVDTETKTVSA